MGKKGKGKSDVLGRALVKDRFGPSRGKRKGESSMLHTADMDDGYKWDRLNLQSVTEESSLQEFLSTAQLAGTEFNAEKLNIKFVNPQSGIGLLSENEKEEMLETHRQNKDILKIPRRPEWDKTTSTDELQTQEKEKFLEWRRILAKFQEDKGVTMTPYEKNLEFWRQLWRVIEKSDIVVQIVDARNPLLFRCEDLELYVKEVNSEKMNMILINKADYLTVEQRKIWADYFDHNGMMVAFFSATLSAEESLFERRLAAAEAERSVDNNPFTEVDENDEDDEDEEDNGDEEDDENEEDDEDEEDSMSGSDVNYSDASEDISESKYESANEGSIVTEILENTETNMPTDSNGILKNSPDILNREKLIILFKSMFKGKKEIDGITTVGLVGYPNVGKSSSINALLMDKKVSVSATPGKTKHYQTLYVDKELLLCDCPGLVMPSFVCTKADMVLNGILPIDQLRDHVPSVTLVGTLIPRHIIEDTYGIMLPPPLEGEEPDRPPTAEEILNTYGFNRGFMTQNGQPDNPRSSRYLLKDFVNGKLLYCVAPPNHLQSEFHTFPPRRTAISSNKVLPARALRASRGVRTTGEDVDKLFFNDKFGGLHVRRKPANRPSLIVGQNGTINECNSSIAGSTQSLAREDKPWKKINKHTNKKKREKTRRLYAHLDQH